jgi:hypothetical protein
MITPSTKSKIRRNLEEISKLVDELNDIQLNSLEHAILFNYSSELSSINDSINDINFQISDTHFGELKDMAQDKDLILDVNNSLTDQLFKFKEQLKLRRVK